MSATAWASIAFLVSVLPELRLNGSPGFFPDTSRMAALPG
ncbi:hypothetical protein B4098_0799 [Heyndrickxia coagulans]|uniref:Uncharacterized protein n=1 Tax=Heyndrickxia coagulans TaxID=1398 RepID=A0A150KC99_HEYCO|nr:hypothetical protein B4098_0799 [Heyndrickxia coagulans]